VPDISLAACIGGIFRRGCCSGIAALFDRQLLVENNRHGKSANAGARVRHHISAGGGYLQGLLAGCSWGFASVSAMWGFRWSIRADFWL
jgi:hypothetical protein